MQTFLPYPMFDFSAKVLDYRRLGKQRVEALQILKGQWPNHPASKMWKGHEYNLAVYGINICMEWRNRGYKDKCLKKFIDFIKEYRAENKKLPKNPAWIGDEEFHLAHQSNLVRKDPGYYKQFFPGVPNNLEYVWPVP